MAVQAVQLSSTGFIANTTGLGLNLSQQLPTFIFIETNDALATVLSSTYLNKSKTDFQFPYSNQQMALVYTTDNGGQTQWLAVTVAANGSGGYNYGLAATADNASVFIAGLGSAAAPSYTFVGRTDVGMYSSAAHTLDFPISGVDALQLAATYLQLFSGNLIVGSHTGSTNTSVRIYSPTASTGYLILSSNANAGDYSWTIENDSLAQSTAFYLGDPTNAIGRIMFGAGATPFISGNLPKASGTDGFMVDSGISATSVSTAINTVNAGVQVATVTLTAAQVIAAYATPELLIPAVAGKVAVIISAIVYTNVSTAFTTGVAPIIQYAATVHGAGTIATGTGLVTGDITAAASQIRTLGAAASTTYTGITNVGIYFSCTTAYAVGTGSTVTFQLVYTYIAAVI